MKTTSKIANHAPLGLLGFGLTTILLNLVNAGITEQTIVVCAMGIAVGGLAQIVAGILEYKNGNTFGGTAFTAYGFFWLSLVLIWINPWSENLAGANNISMGFYKMFWGVFTGFMFIGALKHNMITRLIFGSLALLFFTIALGDFTGVLAITRIAGWIGIITGALALYSSVGQIINNEYKREVFPL